MHSIAVRCGLPLVVLAVVLAACSSSKPEPPVDTNAYPGNYRVQIAGFLRTYLDNPGKLRDTAISEPVLKPVAGTPHYVSCVRYNARGAGNQYMGIQERTALFLGGNLNQFVAANRELCGNAVYQPFPEAEVLMPAER